VCPPSVLKDVISYFPFSPISPYQDVLQYFHAVTIILLKDFFVKRVADCDKQVFKTEIIKHEIRNRTKWNWKLNFQTAKNAFRFT
jgi:hypothetical protein